MREVTISQQKVGINRQRGKGGATGFYDLKNCYITPSGTIKSRPGSVKKVTLNSATEGLFGFGNNLQTFASSYVSVPAGYDLNVILHPTENSPLDRIYYVNPIFGRLYVVAGFQNGDVFHFWLINPSVWTAATMVNYGGRVQPTSENGYVYEVTNLDLTPAWTANTDVAVGTFKQPTTYNGFKFQVTSTTGTPVKTSDDEPVWPTVEGGTVTERRYNTSSAATVPGDSTPPKPEKEPGSKFPGSPVP